MSDGDRVLVTGARSFIGKHCVAALLNAGYRVVGTVRSPDAADEVRSAIAGEIDASDRLGFVEADLLDDHNWANAAEGCRFALHVASPFPTRTPRNPDDLIRPAVEGTRRVMQAAANSGIERVVVTSSVAAIAAGRPDKTDFHDDDWSDPDSPLTSVYARSKTLAERAAWAFAEEQGGPELVAVNPGTVFGPPLDAAHSTSQELVLQFLEGRVPVAIRYGFPVVDVRDVAAVQVSALTASEAVGQRYALSSGFVWLIEMGRLLAERFPKYARRMPKRELPNGLARLGSLFRADLKTARGDLGRRWAVSGAKAERTFGLALKPPEEAIGAMAERIIALGVVK